MSKSDPNTPSEETKKEQEGVADLNEEITDVKVSKKKTIINDKEEDKLSKKVIKSKVKKNITEI